MKYFNTISATVFFLMLTNIVIAGNQRTVANPNVSSEVRKVEDRVSDSSVFTSINKDDNAAEMSSASSDGKKNIDTMLATGLVQSQPNNKDVVKRYNRSSNNQGEKKRK